MARYTANTEDHSFDFEDKSGNVVFYRLIVIDGHQRDQYIKAIRSRTFKNAKGETEVRDMDGLTALILTYAAQRNHGTEDVPDWKPVKLAELQSWPAPMQSELQEIALKMSGLDKKADEDAKNS
jgi:hypothetical protein